MVLSSEAIAAIDQASKLMVKARSVSVFTGAGISVESGIPDFRSPGGLWERYDPFEYCNYDRFKQRPELFWRMARELVLDVHCQLGGSKEEALRTGEFRIAEPNPAHRAIVDLEKLGVVSGVVTQNIDGLHRIAGSKKVIELHGSDRTCTCMTCRYQVPQSEVVRQWSEFHHKNPSLSIQSDDFVPRHIGEGTCGGGVLKSDVTFFGEALPAGALMKATSAVMASSVCLVVGSSLEVAPANMVPGMVRTRFGKVVVCNLDGAGEGKADVMIKGKASEVLPELVQRVKEGREQKRSDGCCIM